MLQDTPLLRARHYEKQLRWQEMMVPEITPRLGASPDEPEDSRPNALVAAASRIVHSSFDVKGGREASTRIFANKPWPTALFAVNDFAAIGTFGTLRGLGLRAGEDVAVVGYNDTVLAAELPVPLTSVHSPMREMGELAFDLLLSRLNGESVVSRVLPPHLVVRESSAGARWDSHSGVTLPG